MATDFIRQFSDCDSSSLLLPAMRERFDEISTWLCDFMGELKVSSEIQNKFLVAADEIFTNIASYAYSQGAAFGKNVVEISVAMIPETKCLLVRFTDGGIPFNPLDLPSPDISIPLHERPIGGLGIHLVRQMMDVVEYRRVNDQNVFLIGKFLSRD